MIAKYTVFNEEYDSSYDYRSLEDAKRTAKQFSLQTLKDTSIWATENFKDGWSKQYHLLKYNYKKKKFVYRYKKDEPMKPALNQVQKDDIIYYLKKGTTLKMTLELLGLPNSRVRKARQEDKDFGDKVNFLLHGNKEEIAAYTTPIKREDTPSPGTKKATLPSDTPQTVRKKWDSPGNVGVEARGKKRTKRIVIFVAGAIFLAATLYFLL